MKIEDFSCDGKIRLYKVAAGEVFTRDAYPGLYFMKLRRSTGNHFKCAELETGDIFKFWNLTFVTKHSNAKMVIGEE